ncbi:hypothetical protein NECAME_08763 [Necator americanus]|uniref:Uncharacterized protein n=1 Tax=Necator americanus TaxID=51031 RepID=W2TIS2_NECAM|nr:hypothetical protein NECAME_08763 [Necator americanus]ETN81061.1 hypothetical protein NECAME_08763 [Necator americanus]
MVVRADVCGIKKSGTILPRKHSQFLDSREPDKISHKQVKNLITKQEMSTGSEVKNLLPGQFSFMCE